MGWALGSTVQMWRCSYSSEAAVVVCKEAFSLLSWPLGLYPLTGPEILELTAAPKLLLVSFLVEDTMALLWALSCNQE